MKLINVEKIQNNVKIDNKKYLKVKKVDYNLLRMHFYAKINRMNINFFNLKTKNKKCQLN